MRFRSALIAVLAAVLTVAAGTQAAPASNDGSKAGLNASFPASGKSTRIHGARVNEVPSRDQYVSLGSNRTHNYGNDNFANRAGIDDILNNEAVCRRPSVCFVSDDNVGATVESFEEDSPGSNQIDCNGVKYDSTVWYGFTAAHNGEIRLDVINTEPNSPDPFLPVVRILTEIGGLDGCGIAFVTTDFSTGEGAGIPVVAGEGVAIAVGARLHDSSCNSGGPSTFCPQGTFDVGFGWDPDTDGDGLLDSVDGCDSTPGGANGIGGCPDADNDNIIDLKDSCDNIPQGPFGRSGCPDSDRDGLLDHLDGSANPDRCIGERVGPFTDNSPHNGCLDILRLDQMVTQKIPFDVHGKRLVLKKKVVIKGIPTGAGVRVRSVCQKPKRHGKRRSCGKKNAFIASASGGPTAHASKKIKLKRFGGKRGLAIGSRIIVRVTAYKAIGYYLRWTVVNRRGFAYFKALEGCMDQGAKKKGKRRGCRGDDTVLK